MATIILGDIVEVIKETVHNPQESGFQYFVGLEHYDSGEPLITRYSTPENLTSSVKHFAKGDILVARRNVYLKRASLVDFEGVTSGDSIVLRAKDKKYQHILPFILNSEDFWDYAEQNSDGTMSKRLSPADLLDYEFEEPADIDLLADKLWAAYRVKESYKKLLAATDDMLKAKFIEMFGEENATTRLGDYVDVKTGKLDSNAANKDGQYPFFTCSSETLKINVFAFDCEAVLLAGNGEFSVKYYEGKFNAYQRTYVIQSKDKNILSVPYLYYWFTEYAKILKTQAIGGVIKYIKLNYITDAHFFCPPLPLQQEFVAIATQAEATKESLRKSIENIDQVIKSLINQ